MEEFKDWWNNWDLKAKNPYEYSSAAFWAFEGWQAARAEALEEAAKEIESCEGYKESPRKEFSAFVRALINKEQAQ